MKTKQEIRAIAAQAVSADATAGDCAFLDGLKGDLDSAILGMARDEAGAREAFESLVRRYGRLAARVGLMTKREKRETLARKFYETASLVLVDEREMLDILDAQLLDAFHHYGEGQDAATRKLVLDGLEARAETLREQLKRQEDAIEEARKGLKKAIKTRDARRALLEAWADGGEIGGNVRG